MSLYRSSSKPPMQSPAKQPDPTGEEAAKRNEYLKVFLTTTILPLWMDNWMQLNVLLHMSTSKPGNSNNQQHHQSRAPPPQQPQSSPSINKTTPVHSPIVQNRPFVTNGSIINLASKSGKKITLEHQPLGKPQQVPSYQSTTPQSTQLLNRSLQLNNDNKLTSKSKTSPPIINLTNTRPSASSSSSSSMHHQMSPSGATKKANSQFGKGSSQTSGSNAKMSPNTLQLQQQQLQYLQQHFDFDIFNTTNNLVSPSGNGGTSSMAYHLNLAKNYKSPSNN